MTFGNEPRVDATLRQQGVNNFDFAVFKKTTISERRGDRIPHRVLQPLQPSPVRTAERNCCLAPPNGNFGQVTNTVNIPRLIQFALKFAF